MEIPIQKKQIKTCLEYSDLKTKVSRVLESDHQPYRPCELAKLLETRHDEALSALLELRRESVVVYTGHLLGFKFALTEEKE